MKKLASFNLCCSKKFIWDVIAIARIRVPHDLEKNTLKSIFGIVCMYWLVYNETMSPGDSLSDC